MTRQQAVFQSQNLFEAQQHFTQLIGGFAVVMEVNLNFCVACPAKFRQGIEVLRPVTLHWVEEGMARWLSVTVAVTAEQPGVLGNPTLDSGTGHIGRRVSQLRFEMVCHAKQEMKRLPLLWRSSPEALQQMRQHPRICLEVKSHAIHPEAKAQVTEFAPSRVLTFMAQIIISLPHGAKARF
jgi:hypothetical protein